MGSFNTSCFVTKQVIIPGNKVILFPIGAIVQSNNRFNKICINDNEICSETHAVTFNGIIGINQTWDILSMPLMAIYNDYGSFTIIETEENVQHLLMFFKFLYSNAIVDSIKDIFENYIHLFNDKTYTFSDLHKLWDELWEDIFDNKVIVNANSHYYQLSFSVASLYVYDYVLNKGDYYKQFVNTINEDIDKFYQKINKLENSTQKIKDALIPMYISDILSESPINFYRPKINTMKVKFTQNELIKLQDILNSKKITASIIYNMVKYRYKFYYFIKYLEELLVIKLEPIAYVCQDYSNDIGNDFIKMAKHVSKKLKKERTLKYEK